MAAHFRLVAVAASLLLFCTAGACCAQMSADEALERLRERKAVASTQPDLHEINELKEVIHELRTQNDDLKAQLASYHRLVPQVPRAGWNFSRVRDAAYAHVSRTGIVFDVLQDGSLRAGTPGVRSVVGRDVAGMPLNLANGTTINSVAHEQYRLPQVALYNLFINNSNPYDPTLDPQSNIRRMTDPYLVLVNVDTGAIDFVEKNEEAWDSIMARDEPRERTVIMSETITVIDTGGR